jgi:hypothetical protein
MWGAMSKQSKGDDIMKMLLATVALAVVVATPALAQRNWPSGNGIRAPYAYPYGRSYNRSYNVYDSRGNYIGRDPDPTVRDQLRRDPSQGD